MLVQMLVTIGLLLTAIYIAYRLFVVPWLNEIEKEKEEIVEDNSDVIQKFEERQEMLRKSMERERLLVQAVAVTEELGNTSEKVLEAEARLEVAEARPEPTIVETKYKARKEGK